MATLYRNFGKSHADSKTPLVSVVVPAYNEAKFIRRTLESLISQDYDNFELIVVDNNSTDDTAAIVRSYGARLISQPLLGVGRARQAGFMAARGEIIATTDADTIVPANWLTAIAKQFGENKDLAAYGGLYTFHSGPKIIGFIFRAIAYWLWFLDKQFNRGWSLPGANMAVRKAAFIKVGGFNTNLQIGEDAELSQRLKTVGSVFLDKTFLVSTSGRRYRKGWPSAAYAYLPNAISRVMLNRQDFNKLPPVRKESTSFLAFANFILTLLLIPVVFFHNSPSAKAERQMAYRGGRMIVAAGQAVRSHMRFRHRQPLLNYGKQ